MAEKWLRERIENATRERRLILNAGDDMLPAVKAQRLKVADEALNPVRMTGDACIAAFFSEPKKNKRQEARDRLAHATDEWIQHLDPKALNRLQDATTSLREGPQPVTPFHWEIEFPEVFQRDNPGFDAFVGNPPFAGKNTLINSTPDGYLDWLKVIHEESHGNADLVAHFFRRAFSLLRQQGAFGLIATNTIGQGDTRATGLRWICTHGGTIFNTRKRYKWPGQAAVVVSVVHIFKGALEAPFFLDGRRVPTITAFLFHAGGHERPVALNANAGKTFIGHFVCGPGFTFDDSDRSGATTSLAEMSHLLAANPACSDRIFPYIGGEEVLNHPQQMHHRFVINFEELSELEARHWPELMAIVERKVRPERVSLPPKNSWNRTIAAKWWLWGAYRKELRHVIKGFERILFIPNLSSYLVCSFLPANVIVGAPHNVIAIADFWGIALLQSRVHEAWARFLASSMKDDLRYTPSDCFETFPFPQSFETNPALESAGKEYYEFRAALMVRNNEGLTKTYNRFHDPEEQSPDILRLRELHAAMDRAVLDAYGWTDLHPTCEFLLDYEEEEDASPEGAVDETPTRARRRRKPWRYRWPDDVRDEVLARLLKLNAERAEEERRAGLASASNEKKKAKRTTRRKRKGDNTGELF